MPPPFLVSRSALIVMYPSIVKFWPFLRKVSLMLIKSGLCLLISICRFNFFVSVIIEWAFMCSIFSLLGMVHIVGYAAICFEEDFDFSGEG